MAAETMGMTAERRRAALRFYTDQLAEGVRAAGPDAVVPTCPGWTVADLVAHVGQTQRWVSDIIDSRVVDPTQLPTEMAEVPTEPQEWPAWLSAGAARAAKACSDEALEAAVFNAAADDRTGGQFWLSSLVNEAVIHGADAAGAAGRGYDLAADVAAELISNHLAMLTSPTWTVQRPQSAAALRGAGETLHWHATDVPAPLGGGDWFVTRAAEGARWETRPDDADVTIEGPATSLLLMLTRRLPLVDDGHELSVSGNVDLARHWIEQTAHVSD